MKLRVVRSIFAALAFTATAIAGASEWQPSGPIRLEVGFAPGVVPILSHASLLSKLKNNRDGPSSLTISLAAVEP